MRISDWSSDVCSSDLTLRIPRQPLEAIIGPQRIAAILNEAQHFGKDCLVQRAIGKRGPDFRQQVGFLERRGAGDGHDMLGQDIKPAGPENVGVSLPSLYGVERRSEEHTSELQSLMRISYAVFCLKKKQRKP